MQISTDDYETFEFQTLTESEWLHLQALQVEFQGIYKLLMGDMNDLLALARQHKTEFHHRLLAQTFFAFVFGMSSQFREVARAYLVIRPGILRKPDACLLSNSEGFRLNDLGIPVAADKAKGGKSLQKLLFGMRCYAKVHFVHFEPDVGTLDSPTPGWCAMREFLDFRDAIANPRSVAAMKFPPQGWLLWETAGNWFKAEFIRLMRAVDLQEEITNSSTAAPARI